MKTNHNFPDQQTKNDKKIENLENFVIKFMNILIKPLVRYLRLLICLSSDQQMLTEELKMKHVSTNCVLCLLFIQRGYKINKEIITRICAMR